ncbi:MAG: hypothetical protein FJX94_08690 [Bacteroidetes bacterium]|nr:hypothetical protein [Bacteroidota bacterium]
MAYRPHGRAAVNGNAPSAFARCDRCGFIYNHKTLQFQFDYRGPRLTNLRILVCQPCYDKPQPQLKPIMTTQDPLPVINARPEDYTHANTDYRVTTGGNYLVTQGGDGFVGTATIAGTVLTVTSVTAGTLAINSVITGNGFNTPTVIASFGTGTGGLGTYNVTIAQNIIIPTTIYGSFDGSFRVTQEAGPTPLQNMLIPQV